MPYFLIFPNYDSCVDLFIPLTGIAKVQVYTNENAVELFLSNGDRISVTKDEFMNAIKPLSREYDLGVSF